MDVDNKEAPAIPSETKTTAVTNNQPSQSHPVIQSAPILPALTTPVTPITPTVMKETAKPVAAVNPPVKQTKKEKRKNKKAPVTPTVTVTPSPSIPVTPANSPKKTTVDGTKLQINPIGDITFPQASNQTKNTTTSSN